jgi:hypothetical protein
MTFENTTRFLDFQAEYEGSIPFTRSSFFKALAHRPSERVGFHSDKRAALHVLMLAFRSPVLRVS